MELAPLAVALLGLLALGQVWRRDQEAARRRRDRFLDDCRPLFERGVITRGATAYPTLRGRHRGRVVTLLPFVEALMPRKLPSLWLAMRLNGPTGARGMFDVLMRPVGVEFYSPSAGLPHRIDPPPGWPEGAVVKCDDPDALPGGPALEAIGALLRDPRLKEVLVTPGFLRLVWQADEGDRGGYLLFRQARFAADHLDPGRLEGWLGRLHALDEALRPEVPEQRALRA
ncbi:hypothetical protein [Inquilinus sp. Marseille-Q2685]|uniref:hypothetical protein n=1 Tax=Inquilinus sp. Marseille-Q2685 TaxID=2866581 RepID=UPI001CE3CC42|nr:hypothetical protein [Inquilinus sp. Marseille-Q2685]